MVANYPTHATASKIVKTCSRLGWSLVETVSSLDDQTTLWTCTVVTGPWEEHVFTATESKRHARTRAWDGLALELRRESQKREVADIRTLFPPDAIPFYNSNHQKHWDMFWNNTPKAVGMHTEGTQQTPPMLVQIATNDYCLVEVPENQTLSPNLQRLLDDPAIVKVFCDGRNDRDKRCLGLSKDSPAVVDLETLMVPVFGPFTNNRGLGRILALCMPELNVRIAKPSRRQPRSSPWVVTPVAPPKPLSLKNPDARPEVLGGTLDAWCKLLAYQRLLAL